MLPHLSGYCSSQIKIKGIQILVSTDKSIFLSLHVCYYSIIYACPRLMTKMFQNAKSHTKSEDFSTSKFPNELMVYA